MEVTKDSDPSRGSAASRHGPIKAYPGFFSVVRLQLGDHVIVLRAEVDAQIEVRFSGAITSGRGKVVVWE